MESAPETRYAKTADGTYIAFSVAGSGPFTVLAFNPMEPVDVMWDGQMAPFLDRLSSFCRHVWYDPRGVGSSGPLPVGWSRVHEIIADDMLAVLDTLGDERVVVLDFANPSYSLLFAATHPARTQALVLFHPSARWRADTDYPGLTEVQAGRVVAMVEREWGTGVLSRMVGMAGDAKLQRWWGKCERLIHTPDEAASVIRSLTEGDLRHVLSTISVPTLVIGGRHPAWVNEQSLYVAEHIDGAAYVEARRPYDAVDAIEEFVTGQLPNPTTSRVLASVLFSDIVSSTERAFDLGDRRWHQRLDAHNAMVRRQLDRFRGREIVTTGDGFLATFDGPARAIQCGCAIRDGARQLGIEVRVGLHTGEIELRGDNIGGVTVNIASRVAAFASSGEVLVSRTVTDLVAGSGIQFEGRGEHELKGVPGTWNLYAVEG